MHSASDVIFKTLADPTRRTIFERLTSSGEQTVRVLTELT
jgi:DNA-binding transcriptional ArsR family regulator